MPIDITITIETPVNMTNAEVLRLFTDHYGYKATAINPVTGDTQPNPQTRAQYARTIIARQVKTAIKAQKLEEDRRAIQAIDITVT